MSNSIRTSSAIARPLSTITSGDSTAPLPTVMWAARLALEVTTSTGTAERIHTGQPHATKQEAMAEAEALAKPLGASVLWFGALRLPAGLRPAGGRN